MMPRPEAPTAQDPSGTKSQLPPKPGTRQEDSKTGIQAAKPSVSSFAAEKEKRFQKDQLVQTIERASIKRLYLHLLMLSIFELRAAKASYSWLALRSASKQYLHLFDKIGTRDVVELVDQIKKSERGVQPEEEANESLSDKPMEKERQRLAMSIWNLNTSKWRTQRCRLKWSRLTYPRWMLQRKWSIKQEDTPLTELAEAPPVGR